MIIFKKKIIIFNIYYILKIYKDIYIYRFSFLFNNIFFYFRHKIYLYIFIFNIKNFKKKKEI